MAKGRGGGVGAVALAVLVLPAMACAAGELSFPPSLSSYGDAGVSGITAVLVHRVASQPLNLWVTLLFCAAVLHTFLSHKFHLLADRLEQRHRRRLGLPPAAPHSRLLACGWARLCHFLGEVEAVFGIWALPLFVLLAANLGLQPAMAYLERGVSYDEPLFVVIIMILAATRPIIALAEQTLALLAGLGNGRPSAWWLTILLVAPLLGSLITEPAAMTIAALLLSHHFYALRPSRRFAYATLGLLFVNVSVGGILTNFAAPPVLMVAAPWQWDSWYMLRHFGWIALLGILVATLTYALLFRRELAGLPVADASAAPDERQPVPVWITFCHLLFMGVAVASVHHPVLLLASFLFFLAFYEVTRDHQEQLQLRAPLLVGFFLAGLVIHGGLQQWWIAPLLGSLGEVPLLFGAMGLTAFNDNAAITYLATLVPDLGEHLRHAVVAGAVCGGGLTVIANAPNPAGQALLNRHFPAGIAPAGLFLGALLPTAIIAACFLLFV